MDNLDEKTLTIKVNKSKIGLKFLNFENFFKKYTMNLLVLKVNNSIIEDSIYYELNDIDILQKINLTKSYFYIFFSINYYVEDSIINFLKTKYKFKFIDYSSELGWCSIVFNNLIKNEYIFYDDIFSFNINLNNKIFIEDDNSQNSINIKNNINIDDNNYYDINNLWIEFIKNMDEVKKNIKNLTIKNLSKKINEIDESFIYIDNYLEEQNKNIKLLREFDNKKKLENKNYLKIYDIEYTKSKILQKEINEKESILNKIENNIILQEKRLNAIIDKINNNLLDNNFNIYNNNNIQFFKRDLCVMVHLYDISLWGELENYLDNLVNLEIKFDLYVNIAYNLDSDLLKKEYMELKVYLENYKGCENFYYTTSNNKGMDIGGFLNSYLKKLKLGVRYKSIIKIHSKTNKNWRFAMLYSLLGSKKIIENNLNLLKHDKVGMIGNDKISIDLVLKISGINYKYIYTYFDRFNIKTNNYGFFIPGSIFWIKDDILMKYLNERNIIKTYKEFKPYYCGSIKNNKEGKPHAFERLFGVMVADSKKLTLKITEKI